MDTASSLQERFAPKSTCFGCGPANEQGLRIRSLVDGEEYRCTFRPEPHHNAFPGMVNGGIIGALLDCHSNWAAAHRVMLDRGVEAYPCTVTAEFHVKLRRPTPLEATLELVAKILESDGTKVRVEATLVAEGKVCATCTGTFVAVKEGHPAFHRWA